MPLSKVWAGSLVLLAAVSLPLHAASPVKVGSKIDTEGALLGNIILQVLESHGVPTVNKVQLGATPVVRGAITSGELDIYPEYTGNGAFFFKDENDAAWKNAQQGYEKVKKLDSEHNKLIWLTPAPANNTWTIAVRQDVAEKNKLTSLADLSRYLQEGGTFKLAASAEFIERADALPAFEKAYGFKLGQDQLLSLAGGDTAVTIKAAAQQTSGVNAAMAYGTDGLCSLPGIALPFPALPFHSRSRSVSSARHRRLLDDGACEEDRFQRADGGTAGVPLHADDAPVVFRVGWDDVRPPFVCGHEGRVEEVGEPQHSDRSPCARLPFEALR